MSLFTRTLGLVLAIAGVLLGIIAAVALFTAEPGSGLDLTDDLGLLAAAVACLCAALAAFHLP